MRKITNIIIAFIISLICFNSVKASNKTGQVTLDFCYTNYENIANIYVYELCNADSYNESDSEQIIKKTYNLYNNNDLYKTYKLVKKISYPSKEKVVINNINKNTVYLFVIDALIKNEVNLYSVSIVNGAKLNTETIHPKGGANNTAGLLEFFKKESLNGKTDLCPSVGAEFNLYKYQSENGLNRKIGNGLKQNTEPLITDENGRFDLAIIPQGRYYLVEEKPAKDNLSLSNDVLNCSDNKLLFDVNKKGEISYPDNSLLGHFYEYTNNSIRHTIINYEKPSLVKTKEQTKKENELKYNIFVNIPWNIDEYSNFQIIDKPSQNLEIDYKTIELNEPSLDPITKNFYTISQNQDSGFTINLKDDFLKLLNGKTIKISYSARIIENNESISNKAILQYIDFYKKQITIEDNLYNYKFKKIDSKTNNPLEGACFVIKNQEDKFLNQSLTGAEWGPIEKATKFYSNNKGEVIVRNLQKEKLFLIEIYSPKGYSPLDNDISFMPGENENFMFVKNEPILPPPPPPPDTKKEYSLPSSGLFASSKMQLIISLLIICALALIFQSSKYKINALKNE